MQNLVEDWIAQFQTVLLVRILSLQHEVSIESLSTSTSESAKVLNSPASGSVVMASGPRTPAPGAAIAATGASPASPPSSGFFGSLKNYVLKLFYSACEGIFPQFFSRLW